MLIHYERRAENYETFTFLHASLITLHQIERLYQAHLEHSEKNPIRTFAGGGFRVRLGSEACMPRFGCAP